MQIFKIISLITLSISLHATQTISMQDALELLKQNNPDLRHSREQRLLLDKQATLHNYRFAPSINPITVDMNSKDNTTDIKTGADWQLPFGGKMQLAYTQRLEQDPHFKLSFNQPITHNTQGLKDQIKANNTEISTLEQQLRYETILLKMRKTYYKSVTDQLLLEHQRNKIEDIRQKLQHYEILYKHGEISKIELDKLFNSLEKEAISLLKNEQTAELNLIELKKLLGLSLHKDIRVDQSIVFQEQKISPTEALTQALANNLGYKIDTLRFKNAKLQYQVTKTLSLPDVSVYASTDDTQTVNAGLKIAIKLPSGEKRYQETADMLSYHQALQKYQDQNTLLRMQIHKQLIELENQAALIDLSAKNLQQQQRIYQAESLKFEYQQISLEAFGQSADQLQSAYQESIQAQIRYSHLRDELLQMIGSLNLALQPTEKTHVQN